MPVIIQQIHSIWTKKSRGGEGARLRNALPKAVLIPSSLKSAPYMLHHAAFSEFSNFSQADECKTAEEFAGLGIRNLEISLHEGRLKIRLYRDGYNAARISGYSFVDAFDLKPGEWGQLTYNGRYSYGEGGWWYEQFTYNIGWVETVEPKLFVGKSPTQSYTELARLR